jgi:hypothetical protein
MRRDGRIEGIAAFAQYDFRCLGGELVASGDYSAHKFILRSCSKMYARC